jgi:lipopolysaccharide cholinephosphotransferase
VERLDTPVCEDNFVKPFVRHMWIDLFPIDGMPKGKLARKCHLYRLLYLRVLAQLADADECINNKAKHQTLRKTAIAAGNLWAKLFRVNPRKRLVRMEKVVQKYDADETGWTISLGSLYKGRTIFPTAYYGKGKEVDFAGRRWLLPEKCEEMLSSLYGDYMTPPPPEKRIGHNLKPVAKAETVQ